MYQIVSEDVTKFKISGKKSAIINSLGYRDYIKDPGALFNSILRASDRWKDIYKDVTTKGYALPFSAVFETGSYGLPSDGIIHSITPFAADDDEGYSKLMDTYSHIFDLALSLKYEAILVSTLGTGANGYETSKVFNLLKKYAFDFSQDHPEIDIYLNVYYLEGRNSSFEDERMQQGERNFRNFQRERVKIDKSFVSRCSNQKVPLKQLKIRNNENFVELIDDYINANFPAEGKQTPHAVANKKWKEIFSNLGYSSANYFNMTEKEIEETKGDYETAVASARKKDLWRNNYGKRKKIEDGQYWTAPQRGELLVIAYTLRMTSHDVYFLMRFCGYYLNDWNEEDVVIKDCIPYVEEEDGLIEIIKEYSQRLNRSLFNDTSK